MPKLKIKKFIYKGVDTGIHDICTLEFQYFSNEETYDIFEHEYIKRYDHHIYNKIGEKNCRESLKEVLYNKNNCGYMNSMAKIITLTDNLQLNDHIIFDFSGYGDCTGWTMSMCASIYLRQNNTKLKPIIDDYQLLMEKFNSL